MNESFIFKQKNSKCTISINKLDLSVVYKKNYYNQKISANILIPKITENMALINYTHNGQFSTKSIRSGQLTCKHIS